MSDDQQKPSISDETIFAGIAAQRRRDGEQIGKELND